MNAFDTQQRAGFEQLLIDAGCTREFLTLDVTGTPVTTVIDCIWSTGENTDETVALSPNGVYFKADVLVTLRADDFPTRPRPYTSVLESPAGNKWQVVEVLVDYGVYSIKLAKNVP